MRMSLIAISFLVSVGCTKAQSISQLYQGPGAAQGALAILGLQEAGATTERCFSCHPSTSSQLRMWGSGMVDVVTECLAQAGLNTATWEAPTQEAALQVVNCFRSQPTNVNSPFSVHRMSLLATATRLPRFENLFKMAYGESYAALYQSFVLATSMPPQAAEATALSEEEFTAVYSWVRNGMIGLEEFLPDEIQAPSSCTASATPELASYLDGAKAQGWEARHHEGGLMMFACSDGNPLNCFTQKNAIGGDRFPTAQSTSFGAQWASDFPGATIRVLHELGFATSYWMRTSPDGRFVANGGNRGDSEGSATITDLQGLLLEPAAARDIAVDAYYDPSFLPDNSGFIFQGDETGICSLSVLHDPAISFIDFTQIGCTRSSEFGISLYQSVGATLDGSDFVAVTGNYAGDSGGSGGLGGSFSYDSYATFQVFVNDGTRYRDLANSSLHFPFQGDFSMSPSNQMMVARFTGAAPSTGETLPLGYNFYSVKHVSNGTNVSFDMKLLGTACTKGKKGMMSFDERFWVTYAPVTQEDYASMGFISSDDPEFRKLVGNSANVILHDLRTGRTHRVTRMGEGQFAQFSHFRSDGWIVFMVYDRNTSKHYVVTSDAAIRRGQEQ